MLLIGLIALCYNGTFGHGHDDGAHETGHAAKAQDVYKRQPVAPGNPDNPVAPGRPDGNALPQSGQLNWPIPFMACSGVLLFAVGWVDVYKRQAQ